MKAKVRANTDISYKGRDVKRGEEFTTDYDTAKTMNVTILHVDKDVDRPYVVGENGPELTIPNPAPKKTTRKRKPK